MKTLMCGFSVIIIAFAFLSHAQVRVQVNASQPYTDAELFPTGCVIWPVWCRFGQFDPSIVPPVDKLDKPEWEKATEKESLKFYKEEAIFFCLGGRNGTYTGGFNNEMYDPAGNHNFAKLKVAIDKTLRLGLLPDLFLGNTPEALSNRPNSGVETVFGVNIGKPSNYSKYDSYLDAFFNFLVSTYGAASVASWRFHIMPEPDNRDMWDPRITKTHCSTGNRDDFLEYFDHIYASMARVVGSQNAHLSPGHLLINPLKPMGFNDWTDDFVQHFSPNQRVDEFGISLYGSLVTDPSSPHYYTGVQMGDDPRSLKEIVLRNRSVIAASFPTAKFVIGEGTLHYDENDRLLVDCDKTSLGTTWYAAILKNCFDANVYRYSNWGVTAFNLNAKSPIQNVFEMFSRIEGFERVGATLSNLPAQQYPYIDVIAARDQKEGKHSAIVFSYSNKRTINYNGPISNPIASTAVEVKFVGLKPNQAYKMNVFEISSTKSTWFDDYVKDLNAQNPRIDQSNYRRECLVDSAKGPSEFGFCEGIKSKAVEILWTNTLGNNKYPGVDDLQMVQQTTVYSDNNGNYIRSMQLEQNSVILIELSSGSVDVGAYSDGVGAWMVSKNVQPNGGNQIYQYVKEYATRAGTRISGDNSSNCWLVNSSNQLFKYTSGSWKLQTKAAKDVGVGADGSVWIVSTEKASSGSGYNIYKLSGTTWKKMSGAGVAIDVDPSGNPWLVNSSNQLLKYSNGSWVIQTKAAKDVGIGADGSVWIISAESAPSGGYHIYKLYGTTFIRTTGAGVAIDVNPSGNPWVANSDNQIFEYVYPGWINRGSGRDVGISKQGVIWMISNTAASSGGCDVYRIYWKDMLKAGARIDVSPTNEAWVVTSDNQLFKYASGWQVQTMGAKDVGVGGNGSVWIVSNIPALMGIGYDIYTLIGTTWTKISGAGVAIDVDLWGNPWVVNSSNQLYKNSNTGWELQSKTAKDVCIGANGSVWIVSTETAPSGGYNIYKLNENTWTRMPGAGVAITCDKVGNPWLVNSNGSVFEYVNSTWVQRFN